MSLNIRRILCCLLNKAAIVELPLAASDVLVSQPNIVDAVIKTPRRVFLMGRGVGQTNAFFFDSRGRQILNLEISVEQDTDVLEDLIARVMPESRVSVEALNNNVVLRGVVQTPAEATNAGLLAMRFAGSEDLVVNMLTIRDPEQVMLKVRIVEMQRQLMKQLGISTSGQVTLPMPRSLLHPLTPFLKQRALVQRVHASAAVIFNKSMLPFRPLNQMV